MPEYFDRFNNRKRLHPIKTLYNLQICIEELQINFTALLICTKVQILIYTPVFPYTNISYRIYLVRILRLKFSKFQECLKNKPMVEILKWL